MMNMLPISANLDNKSPYEMLAEELNLTEKTPYIQQLRTFGYTIYIYKKGMLRPKCSYKIEPQALKGQLIGYNSLYRHIFLIWVPSKERVYHIYNIRFWEGHNDIENNEDQLEDPEYDSILIDPDIWVET